MVDLHERIIAWRIAKGLTLQELADRIGVTMPAVYQWEHRGTKKRATPSTESLLKITEALGITMVEFWGPLPTSAPKKKRKAS